MMRRAAARAAMLKLQCTRERVDRRAAWACVHEQVMSRRSLACWLYSPCTFGEMSRTKASGKSAGALRHRSPALARTTPRPTKFPQKSPAYWWHRAGDSRRVASASAVEEVCRDMCGAYAMQWCCSFTGYVPSATSAIRGVQGEAPRQHVVHAAIVPCRFLQRV